MNCHTDLQNIRLESLMNDNDRIDKNINETLQNRDVTTGIGLLNRHTTPPKIMNKVSLMR